MRASRTVGALAALATSACSLALDWNGLSSDAGAAGGAAGAAGAAGVGGQVDAACIGAAGPGMVQIGAYCIDSTEVTNAQYQVFLDTGPDPSDQVEVCPFNTSLQPAEPIDPALPSYPITYVDWCDAVAYCRWAGKVLCGRIEGGPAPLDERFDPGVSQWHRACSRNGSRDYPYGSTPEAVCNAGPSASNQTAPVASHPDCVGGYDGIFDMVGNVAEWEDGCSPDADGDPGNDPCSLRGDDFDDIGTASCAEDLTFERSARTGFIGFRCCAQAL
jgi:formylglycine-generating enzyme required for sulfatase activity